MANRKTRPLTSGRKTFGIKVNHLPHDITEEEVQSHFNCFGSIENVVLKTGHNECYAFVNFHSSSCAVAAAEKMNGTMVNGNKINCKAQSESMRPPSIGEYPPQMMGAPQVQMMREPHPQMMRAPQPQMMGAPQPKMRAPQPQMMGAPHPQMRTPQPQMMGAPQPEMRTPQPQMMGAPQPQMRAPQLQMMGAPQPQMRARQLQMMGAPHPQMRAPQLQMMGAPHPQMRAPQLQMMGAPHPQMRAPQLQMRAPRSPSSTHSARQLSGHPHPVAIQRHLSQPASMTAMPQPAHVPNTVKPQSCTAKVSIFGVLSPDDIEEVFSQFGQIRVKPIIRGGDPFFTFINFTSTKAAADACHLHNATVKGIKIYVRVHVPKKKPSPNLESREIRCTSLVASILHSRHRDELERLKNEHNVRIPLKPSSECIKVWGEKEAVTAVEVCLQDLVAKITADISVQDCELPVHSVPLFKQESALDELRRVEESNGVEFGVLRAPPDSTPVVLETFCKDVKECFTPTKSEGANTIATCSKLASYLKEKPKSPSTSKPETTWLWENDSGSGFSPYEPDVCAQLSKALADSQSVTLEIGSFEYSIDFLNMTQTNITSGRSRPIKQVASSSLSVKWFYKNDRRSYAPYTTEQSAEIEQMFLNQSKIPRTLNINHNMYTFDFISMTQCNVQSRNSRKIERRVEVNNEDLPIPIEHVLTVRASGIPPSLDIALRELENMVTKATVEKECQLYAGSSASFKADLVKNMNQYLVTAELMDECLKLKGVTEYVEKVSLQAEQAKISDREQHMGGLEFELPNCWEPQSKVVCLNVVKRGSDEWKKEVKNIHVTLGEVTVVKLERIQNKWLWERYSFAKKRMSETNKGDVNEKHLFHGTRSTPPEKVFRSEKGVDFRYSKEGLWGAGSYFAVNASYSDRYAFPVSATNEKQMFICKVLTGESYIATDTDRSLRQPPLKPFPTHGSFEEERYDSVKGHTNGSYVYVVYDHEKVYPAYLVTYRKPQHHF